MIVDRPACYALSQRLVGKAGLYRHLVRSVLTPGPQTRILDIGCGTGELLRFMPGVRYSGFDSDPARVAVARRRFAGRGRFFVGRIEDAAAGDADTYDIAVAVGVLHHLDDAAIDRLCRCARFWLAPGGRLVTIDPALVPHRPIVDRVLTALDRGSHVRTPARYRELIEPHFAAIRQSVRTDLLRFRQTLVLLDATAAPSKPGVQLC